MAVVNSIPAQTVVIAFRGTLDFYCYRGLFCVRSWPRSPKRPRSPAVQISAQIFSDFSRRIESQNPVLTDTAKALTHGSKWTWKDITTFAAYGHLIRW